MDWFMSGVCKILYGVHECYVLGLTSHLSLGEQMSECTSIQIIQ
jgi:hypothetical protein